MTADLREAIRLKAASLGFDAFGIARADEPLGVEHDRYEAFLAAGMHGSMAYLAENAEARRRLDTSDILEGAKSVICVGRRYARAPEDEARDPPLAQAIARYARGQDYHVFLRKKVRRLASFVRSLGDGVRARVISDVEPVLERAWASRAGLGFIGKNGLVITPGQGSYQLLGEVVTTLTLPADEPITERCGQCTRCLDACPTQAFVAPFVLDPRRCVSYWTIEQPQSTAPSGTPEAAGIDAVPEELRAAVSEHLFGCDVCQEVCPWNRAAPADAEATTPFRPLERWRDLDVDDLVHLSPSAWAEVAIGTPLHRAGRAGIARNAARVSASRIARGKGSDPGSPAVALDAATAAPDKPSDKAAPRE